MSRPDPFSPEKRSEVMRAVAHFDTAAEMRLRRALWSQGLRYRIHQKIARAKPDLVFTGARVAVFVDGCFWHGCPVHYSAPVNNAVFWREKLDSNVARDRRNDQDLADAGWTVVRVWECEVNGNLDEVARRIHRMLAQSRRVAKVPGLT